ncbi:helix-turn-helix domain-containing protein [Nocardia arthritidis]|uniref:Helix-turn-helix domain-containing protein n=1 Tax=Nocardia arthritidis TaxID=228602 RepID=A0A6G9YPB6_9NOCA|nr:helix-turn-helix transcriptional regulator [Nocardia arthritidis]QIS15054.1 helix-turn-helix domain-containing protein [Nocardia arthritidis]
MSDNELGLFLRMKRESVTPAEAGLPAGPRRRTSGLRRAEVAMLADVSVEYIIRLEQGRDRHPSAEVLTALADALRMSPSERVHLYRMTKIPSSAFHCLGGAQPNRVVRPFVMSLLEQLEPAPAAVVNRLCEVLACTDGYRALMGPIGLLDGGLPANVVRYIFTDERAKAAYPDWGHVADKTVATLKQGPVQGDSLISALVEELTVTVGAEFTDRMRNIPGLAAANGIERMTHPEVGELRLAFETLELSADDDQRIVVRLPADPAAARALDLLAGRRPGALRAVSGFVDRGVG